MEFVAASEYALKIAKIAAQAAYDKKAENIVLLDVSEHLVITDIFLIVSADNERQVGAIVDAIEAALDEIDVDPIRREGNREGRWVLLRICVETAISTVYEEVRDSATVNIFDNRDMCLGSDASDHCKDFIFVDQGRCSWDRKACFIEVIFNY